MDSWFFCLVVFLPLGHCGSNSSNDEDNRKGHAATFQKLPVPGRPLGFARQIYLRMRNHILGKGRTTIRHVDRVVGVGGVARAGCCTGKMKTYGCLVIVSFLSAVIIMLLLFYYLYYVPSLLSLCPEQLVYCKLDAL